MKKKSKELHGINGVALEILPQGPGWFKRFLRRIEICWWVFFGKDNWRLIVKTGNSFWDWNRNEKWIATIRMDAKQKKDYDPWKDPNNLPQKWIYPKDHSEITISKNVKYTPISFVLEAFNKAGIHGVAADEPVAKVGDGLKCNKREFDFNKKTKCPGCGVEVTSGDIMADMEHPNECRELHEGKEKRCNKDACDAGPKPKIKPPAQPRKNK